jgi:hypothetical protein
MIIIWNNVIFLTMKRQIMEEERICVKKEEGGRFVNKERGRRIGKKKREFGGKEEEEG